MDAIDSPPAPLTPKSFFTPLLISMLGILSTSMAIVVYHYILARYCTRREETSDIDSQQPVPDARLMTGVEEKILETIPILPYSTKKGDIFRVDQTECAVCLGELEDEDTVRLLPNCRHAFHVPCVDKWFMAHDNCPVCRSPIVAPAPPIGLPLHTCIDGHEHDRDHHHTDRPRADYRELPLQRRDRHDHASDAGSDINAPLLRHCATEERRSSCLVMELKRSLSMDHSYVFVDIQRESEREMMRESSTSKNEDLRTRLYRARSIRQWDRVSSKLLTSFSRLRMGRGSSTPSGILPY